MGTAATLLYSRPSLLDTRLHRPHQRPGCKSY